MVEASALCRAERGRVHVRVASLCFLVLFLEGYDITSMSYAIPSLVEAWHAKPPQTPSCVSDRSDYKNSHVVMAGGAMAECGFRSNLIEVGYNPETSRLCG
jgi:hypothetical protein